MLRLDVDWDIYYLIASNKAILDQIALETQLVVPMIKTTISENCDHLLWEPVNR